MAKVKVHRSQPSIDMTPMVDLAFLLVTFFMLTTKFTPEEAIIVDMPASVSEIKLPDTDILTLTISQDGKIFFSIDGQYHRQQLLTKIGAKYNLIFNDEQIRNFSLIAGIGVPIGSLKEFLSMSNEERKNVKQPGIPCKDGNNELIEWIVQSRVINPNNLRVAIKGDRNASYPVVQQVINTLLKAKVNRFNLVTDLEKES